MRTHLKWEHPELEQHGVDYTHSLDRKRGEACEAWKVNDRTILKRHRNTEQGDSRSEFAVKAHKKS